MRDCIRPSRPERTLSDLRAALARTMFAVAFIAVTPMLTAAQTTYTLSGTNTSTLSWNLPGNWASSGPGATFPGNPADPNASLSDTAVISTAVSGTQVISINFEGLSSLTIDTLDLREGSGNGDMDFYSDSAGDTTLNLNNIFYETGGREVDFLANSGNLINIHDAGSLLTLRVTGSSPTVANSAGLDFDGSFAATHGLLLTGDEYVLFDGPAFDVTGGMTFDFSRTVFGEQGQNERYTRFGIDANISPAANIDVLTITGNQQIQADILSGSGNGGILVSGLTTLANSELNYRGVDGRRTGLSLSGGLSLDVGGAGATLNLSGPSIATTQGFPEIVVGAAGIGDLNELAPELLTVQGVGILRLAGGGSNRTGATIIDRAAVVYDAGASTASLLGEGHITIDAFGELHLLDFSDSILPAGGVTVNRFGALAGSLFYANYSGPAQNVTLSHGAVLLDTIGPSLPSRDEVGGQALYQGVTDRLATYNFDNDGASIYRGAAFGTFSEFGSVFAGTLETTAAARDLDIVAMTNAGSASASYFALLMERSSGQNPTFNTGTGVVNFFSGGIVQLEVNGANGLDGNWQTLNYIGLPGYEGDTVLMLDENSTSDVGSIVRAGQTLNVINARLDFLTSDSLSVADGGELNVMRNSTIYINNNGPASGDYHLLPGAAMYISGAGQLERGAAFNVIAPGAGEQAFLLEIDNDLGTGTVDNATLRSVMEASDVTLHDSNADDLLISLGQGRRLITPNNGSRDIAATGTLQASATNLASVDPNIILAATRRAGGIYGDGDNVVLTLSLDSDHIELAGVRVTVGDVNPYRTHGGDSRTTFFETWQTGVVRVDGDSMLGDVTAVAGQLRFGDNAGDIVVLDSLTQNSIYGTASGDPLGSNIGGDVGFDNGQYRVLNDLVIHTNRVAFTAYGAMLDPQSDGPIVGGNIVVNSDDFFIDDATNNNLAQALIDGLIADDIVINNGGSFTFQINPSRDLYDPDTATVDRISANGLGVGSTIRLMQDVYVTGNRRTSPLVRPGDTLNDDGRGQIDTDLIQSASLFGYATQFGDGTDPSAGGRGGIRLADGAVFGIDNLDSTTNNRLKINFTLEGTATISGNDSADNFDLMSLFSDAQGEARRLVLGELTNSDLGGNGSRFSASLEGTTITTALGVTSYTATVSGDITLDLANADLTISSILTSVTPGGLILRGAHNTAGSQLLGAGTITASTGYDLRSGTVEAILAGTVGVFKNDNGGADLDVTNNDNTVTLAGLNLYEGGTLINAGTLVVENANANLGAPTGTVTLAGGRLLANGTFSLTDGVTDRAIVLAGGALGATDGNALTLPGLLAGAGDLIKIGPGELNITGAGHTFAGDTLVRDGVLRLSESGALPTDIAVVSTGRLILDNAAANADRLGDGATVTLAQSGLLRLIGNAAGTTETIGNLVTADGDAQIAIAADVAGQSTLSINDLLRPANGTLFVRGSELGDASAAGVANISVGSINGGVVGAALVGGGGGTGTTTISILPWAIGSVDADGSGTTFVTVDVNGLRPLDLATEYDNLAAFTSTSNVRVQASQSGLFGTGPGNALMNSLIMDNSTGFNLNIDGFNSLVIGSGALLAYGATALDTANITGFASIESVSGELLVGVTGPSDLTLYVPFNNADAVVKAGDGTLVLDASGSGGNGTRTGSFVLNGGLVRIVDTTSQSGTINYATNGRSPLGVAGTDLVLNGGTIEFAVNGNGISGSQALVFDTDLFVQQDATILVGAADGGSTGKAIRVRDLSPLDGTTLTILNNGVGSYGITFNGAIVTPDAGTFTLSSNRSVNFSGQLTGSATIIKASPTGNNGTLQISRSAGSPNFTGNWIINQGEVLGNNGSGATNATNTFQPSLGFGAAGTDVFINQGNLDLRGRALLTYYPIDVIVRDNDSTIQVDRNSSAMNGNTIRIDTLNLVENRVFIDSNNSFNLEIGTTSLAPALVLEGQATFNLDANPTDVDLLNNPLGTYSRPVLTLLGGITEIGGSYGFNKIGDGRMALTAAGDYTGETWIADGALEVRADGALGSADGATYVAMRSDSADLVNNGSILVLNDVDYQTLETIYIEHSGHANPTMFSNLSAHPGALVVEGTSTFAGTIRLLNDATIGATSSTDTLHLTGEIEHAGKILTFIGGGTFDISGAIAGFTDRSDLVVAGGSTVRLTNSNSTFVGTTSILDGQLILGASSLADAASGTLGGGHRKPVLLGDSTGVSDASLLIEGALELGLPVTVQSGSTGEITLGGTNVSGFATFSGPILLNRDTRLTAALGGTVIIDGDIEGVGGITKVGEGTVALAGTGGYTGATIVEAGVLSMDSRYSILGSNQLTLDGGTLAIAGTMALGDQPITLGAAGGTIDVAAGELVDVMTAIGGAGSLTKLGGGELLLSTANVYSGDTLISDGVVRYAVNGAINSNTTVTISGASAVLDTAGFNDTLAALVLVEGQILGGGVITSDATLTHELQSGTVDAVLAGATSIEKTDAGAVVLEQVNTYTGSTDVLDGLLVITTGAAIVNTSDVTIDAGTLEVAAGGQLASATIDVGNSGTLIADGSIDGLVEIANTGLLTGGGQLSDVTISGGTIAPGNSPGALTSSSSVISSGTYQWEINQLAAGTGLDPAGDNGLPGTDPGWDWWVAGDVTISGPLSVELISLNSADDPGALANWDPSQEYSWLIATSTNSGFTQATIDSFLDIDPLSPFFAANGALFANFGLFAGAGGDQLLLNYTAIPEPGTLLLTLLGAAGLGGITRRRRRSAGGGTAIRAPAGIA